MIAVIVLRFCNAVAKWLLGGCYDIDSGILLSGFHGIPGGCDANAKWLLGGCYDIDNGVLCRCFLCFCDTVRVLLII